MTISILQSAINTAQFAELRTDTTVSVTLPGVTAGSSIAVFVTLEAAYSVTGVSDGAAYTQRQSIASASCQQRTYLFTLDSVESGSHTIVATLSPPAPWNAIEAFEIGETSGYSASASQNQETPGTGTDGLSSTAATPGENGNLILGWSQNGWTLGAPAAGTGFTGYSTNATIRCSSEYVVQGAASSIAATFTAAVNVGHLTFVASFKPTVIGQFARPSSDVSAGTWSPSTGGSIAACIDETPFSDTDYASATANGTFRVNLSSVSTPDTGTRTVRFRSAGSSAKKLIVSLIEGASTTVASTTIDPLPAAVTAQSFTVSNSISNYADLDISVEVADATTSPTPAVTFVSIGAGANGGTSVAPTYPASIAAGDLLVLTVTSGGATSPTPSTPSGWTSWGSYVTTDGTYGIDTGPRRVTVFTKVAAGGETGTLAVTVTGGDSCRGSIMRVTKGQASYTWDVAATGGDYSAAGTAVSVTGGAIGFAPGDLVIVSNCQRVDTVTQSAQALGASGITFGTLTNRTSTAVTTGNDHRHVIDSRPVSTGSASVAPTWSYTASAACSAAIHFLRIREIPPTEFARFTFAESEVPAAVAGGAALAGGASAAASAVGVVVTTLAVSGAAIAISVPAATMSSSIPLAGSAQSAAAVAGTASIAKPVAGAATSAAAPAGALTTVDALNGIIQVVASPAGALQMVANLSGSALAQSAIAAAMTTVQAAAGAAAASASASGTLGATPATLTGQSISAAVTAAALGTEIRAAGGAASLSAVLGALSGAAATLAGQAATQANVNAALTTVTALAGQVLDTTTVQGALGVAAAALQGLAGGQTTASGNLTIKIAVQGQSLATALAQAGLTSSIRLEGATIAAAQPSGFLYGSTVPLAGAALSSAIATGNLQTSIPVSAQVLIQALVSGGLSVTMPISGFAAAALGLVGSMDTQIATAGGAFSSVAAVGFLTDSDRPVTYYGCGGRIARQHAEYWWERIDAKIFEKKRKKLRRRRQQLIY